MHSILKRTVLAVAFLSALACAAAPAFAETYTLAWDPVTTYADGSAIEAGKTVAYTVYWSTDATMAAASLKAIASGTSATSAALDLATAGMTRGTTVYFTAKSTLSSGEESSLSTAVAWSVPKKAPNSPNGMKIIRLN